MRVLALLAQKGGAGKSTLALHLGVLAQQEGVRTLLVDLDPQRSTAAWWRGLRDYGLPVVPVAIHQRADLAHALIDGRAVSEFAPTGKATRELRQLWRWAKENMA